jgi:protein-S-isoprenylcysteine O-methyltransferase Ste14
VLYFYGASGSIKEKQKGDARMDWIKLVLFTAGSLGLGYVSRAVLFDTNAHGFYRFFAWELILAVILINLDHWFVDPLSYHQLFSWLCLVASIFMVIPGLIGLRKMGRPDQDREDDTLLTLEKTTQLVTSGIYHWVRHPLYSSLLFLVWGACLKHLTWQGLALTAAATAFLTATACVEERENVAFFGSAYIDYQKHTRMFIPFIL